MMELMTESLHAQEGDLDLEPAKMVAEVAVAAGLLALFGI